MADWRAREAHNEARFREQNEWIEATETSYGASGPLMRFVCECGDVACTQAIELTMSEYESVRAAANRFAVAPNHENPESEVIVGEHARFTIVDKITGPALEIARETDPRAPRRSPTQRSLTTRPTRPRSSPIWPRTTARWGSPRGGWSRPRRGTDS